MFNISAITTGLLDYQNKQAKFLKKPFLFVFLFAIFFLLLTAVMTVWLIQESWQSSTAILMYVLANQMCRIYPNDQSGSFQAGKR